MAAGTPFLSIGAANAEAVGNCSGARVEYSVDGGRTWSADRRMSEPHGVIDIRLTGEPGAGCVYKVSLASYDTEGPTWPTSGHQTFLGWATVTLDRDRRGATLDVSAHLPKCYGQIDLYAGDEKFDGVDNPLPSHPEAVIADRLISGWNGGARCEPEPTASPTATPTTDPTGVPTAVPTPTATSSPTVTASPTATATADPVPSTAPEPSEPATGAPSTAPGDEESPSPAAPSPSASAGTPSGPSTAPPAPGGNLAQTGGDGGRMLGYGVGGAALLVAGAGVLVAARRRAARR